MNRRTFVLLGGTTVWSYGRLVGGASGHAATPPLGRLRFTLDDRRRWALWFQSGGAPLPLIEGAELGVWIGDRLVTLADLEDTAIGNRRPPSGESLVVRGRAAGVVLEAEFVTGDAGPAPQGGVTVNIYPDRYLPACRGVRYFAVPDAAVLPGADPLVALVNGYESRSACRVTRLPVAASELTSHAALGLTRGRHGLGLTFDPGEPGEAAVRLSREGLAAASDWLPARPLRPQGDSATLRLAYRPEGDGAAALGALFEPASPVDRERLDALAVPAGWCSRYALPGGATEEQVIANLEFCAAHFDRRYFRYVQLDDGYQRAAGDWECNDRFPHGHRWLTDRVHAHGLEAGLWLAPFAAAEHSGIPADHPDWLLRDANGAMAFDGRLYGLDGAHPEVQEWLYALARRVSREWGYDYVKLDLLHLATAGAAHHGGLTHAEAYRRGLAAIRDGLGPEPFLAGCGAPLQHAHGLVNAMRVGADVEATWTGARTAARAAALRSFYHRGAWLNDPDCLLARPPLGEAEVRAWASVVALTGSPAMFSDDLPTLPPDRLAVLRRTLPVAPAAAGRSFDVMVEDRNGEPPAPPSVWVAEGAPGWWTVALVNWEDAARQVAVPLAQLGMTGRRLAAYDVWQGVPLPDVSGTLDATLEPHSTLTVALRPALARPQVIGTTRHVVQGAVDLAAETWDATARALRGRSTGLQGRAYAITIAVPRSLRPTACRADVPCTMDRLETGHVVIAWPDGGDGRDISWEVRFRTVSRT